jgi:hypothetical protein
MPEQKAKTSKARGRTMNIFQAISQADTVRKFFEKTQVKLNYLVAFDLMAGQTDKFTKDYRDRINLLYLESGGYGVRKGRAKVTLADYLQYLQRHGHLYDKFTSFDDKHNDFAHNSANLRVIATNLPDFRKNLMPVIHEPVDYLQEIRILAQEGYDHIAIGTPKKIQDAVFQTSKVELPQVKFHLLGKLNRQILRRHQPDSADASSWLKAAVYGIMHFWHPEEKREYKIYAGDQDKSKTISSYQNFQHREQLEELLASTFGYSQRDVLSSNEARAMVNLYFYKQLEDHLNDCLAGETATISTLAA